MNTLSIHTYEEIRGLIVDILLNKEKVKYSADHYRHLVLGVTEVFGRRESPGQQFNPLSPEIRLQPQDTDLIRDIFWDLFRQGIITLGINDSNEGWPWFRLSHFGEQILKTQSPYRFHDTNSFLSLVKKEAHDISDLAITYLEEAVAAFYADCLLSSCVMLGGAAETEFLRLIDAAQSSASYGSAFAGIPERDPIREKITKFHNSLKKLKGLPYAAMEDHEINFMAIQSILRIARNDAGHPTAVKIQREQVYVNLQLFVPFARQLMRLREALK